MVESTELTSFHCYKKFAIVIYDDYRGLCRWMPQLEVSATMSKPADPDISPPPGLDHERQAVTSCTGGFLIRPPPKPHLLAAETTLEEELFLAIHMGVADVDKHKWLLAIDGLVRRPFALTYQQLLKLPSSSINAFHECFGNPLNAPITALWRIGNVTWTGVRLRTLLAHAEPFSSANFVWSEGLDSGVFADVYADRYQKDLPLFKALSPEVLVAYAMNGKPLSRERGGPVRLVVPGWFGTNSTKWLSKLTLSEQRASGPYTTTFYNIKDPDSETVTTPVWQVEVNSMIVKPAPGAVIVGSKVEVEGWAWSHDGVIKVEVSLDGGATWREAQLWPRTDFSWQKFLLSTRIRLGSHVLTARAFSEGGKLQPLSKWRNHSHSVSIEVIDWISR